LPVRSREPDAYVLPDASNYARTFAKTYALSIRASISSTIPTTAATNPKNTICATGYASMARPP
jgi:hypothetical protein